MMSVCFDKIPDELKARSQWVVWRYETRGGSPTKVPYQANKPDAKASVTDHSTWAPFTEAAATYARGGFDGIGYVLAPDDPYVGLDFDRCVDLTTGEIDEWARTDIEQFKSYTELSPSGEGVRIFIRGTLPPEGRNKRMPLLEGVPEIRTVW